MQVRQIECDEYKRLVAEVFVNDRSVNLTMVQEGQAVVYRQYLQACASTKDQFLQAEADTKSQKLGFWNQSQPVMPWDGELAVELKHLKSFDYLPAECQQMQVICDGGTPSFADRINRVYSSGLEESVQRFLESLGKLNWAYLTELEEKLLTLIEKEL